MGFFGHGRGKENSSLFIVVTERRRGVSEFGELWGKRSRGGCEIGHVGDQHNTTMAHGRRRGRVGLDTGVHGANSGQTRLGTRLTLSPGLHLRSDRRARYRGHRQRQPTSDQTQFVGEIFQFDALDAGRTESKGLYGSISHHAGCDVSSTRSGCQRSVKPER